MLSLAIRNLTANRLLFQDPSGFSEQNIVVLGNEIKANIQMSRAQFSIFEPVLEAAVKAGRITYSVVDDQRAEDNEDDIRVDTRIVDGLLILANIHDKVIICKPRMSGNVKVILPSALPVGMFLDVLDGTVSDTSINTVSVIPEESDTVNGAGVVNIEVGCSGVRLKKMRPGEWISRPREGVIVTQTFEPNGSLEIRYGYGFPPLIVTHEKVDGVWVESAGRLDYTFDNCFTVVTATNITGKKATFKIKLL